MIDRNAIRKALRDGHSKRRPRPCGMTIHTSIGCKFGCIYCYVPDMGFPMKPQPYPLTGLELVYALLNNPYFLPGPYGTLLAFGSVTEPFMDESVERTIEYLEKTRKFLGNPTQISTKAAIDDELLNRLLQVMDPQISFLVTIITIKHAKKLEPNAPGPDDRFETIKRLSKASIHVTLFLRPIIPGLTDSEIPILLSKAKESGAIGVVPGSLRVTPGILRRLELAGLNINKIKHRLPRQPRNSKDQVTIKEHDLKQLVNVYARKLGLHVYPSSCAANIEAHSLSCYSCRWGPCGDPHRLPAIEDNDIKDAIEFFNLKPTKLVMKGNRIIVYVKSGDRKTKDIASIILSTLTKRDFTVK
ncbi:MAG TPA: radical SAM protein [Pyrodictium sp.]|nr:radical SAM protein [Pyrodictium sp.]HIQ55245.1 radical SAM protein [Pyrodictium sp.]